MLPRVRFETRRSIRNFTNSVTWLSLAACSFGQFRSASGFVSSSRVQGIMSTHEPMVMVVPASLFYCGQKKKKGKKKTKQIIRRHMFAATSRHFLTRNITKLMMTVTSLCDEVWLAFISTQSLCTSGAMQPCYLLLLDFMISLSFTLSASLAVCKGLINSLSAFWHYMETLPRQVINAQTKACTEQHDKRTYCERVCKIAAIAI